ncbi:TetR-like C-terminal domain-containing protein [Streptomyces sp. TS71-3]|uniref:TetR-like C-terminal domain-containing protein n=1 Tax=Streptomyces sp. TS71-3 TaxID=2733862 RepID=UPI0020177CCB|nr:TetR-like C-terminal domain-containing protein [Streptomyces sp. TS71-3]
MSAIDDAPHLALTSRIRARSSLADRHSQLGAILDRERARGWTVPEVGRAADTLLGPLLYRAVFANDPPDPAWAKDLVDSFLS